MEVVPRATRVNGSPERGGGQFRGPLISGVRSCVTAKWTFAGSVSPTLGLSSI